MLECPELACVCVLHRCRTPALLGLAEIVLKRRFQQARARVSRPRESGAPTCFPHWSRTGSFQDDFSKPKKCWGANIGHEKKQDDWTGKKWPWSPSRQAARLFSQPPLKRTGDRYRLGRSTSARLACSPRWCFRGRHVLRRHRTGAPFSLPARFADALGGACRRCRASDELRDVVPAASGSICGASHDRKCR